jgi:hypothetical protein
MWRRTRQAVAQPKLLVLLHASTELLADLAEPGGGARETAVLFERLEQLQTNLRRRASQQDQAPVLQLDAGDADKALNEAAAAAQAMR